MTVTWLYQTLWEISYYIGLKSVNRQRNIVTRKSYM